MYRAIIAGLLVTVIEIAGSAKPAAAEYVWARSQWMIGPNRPVGVMNNGYGGYYVPKNAPGNNYEGRPFNNPTGFVIPANSGPRLQQVQPIQHRRFFRRR